MLFAKHAVCSTAGLFGGVFGYLSATPGVWAAVAAFVGMLACACVADILTQPLEEDEDDESGTDHEAA